MPRSPFDELLVSIASGEPTSLHDILARSRGLNDSGDEIERTPLAAAAFAGRCDLIRELVAAGAGVDVPSRCYGLRALHEAVAMDQYEAVATLLELGADVDAPTGQGCTALMIAAAWGHCEILRLLLSRGADLHRVDCTGATATSAACEKEQPEAEAILRAAGGVL